MGSDTSPDALLDAILHAHTLESLVLFATKEVFAGRKESELVHFCPVQEFISMEDDPLLVLRRKKNSSLCVGIRALQEKKIDAFVSAGNTGALMAYATFQLPMLPSIKRATLLTLLPTKKREVAVLDVGANVTAKSCDLLQFAQMGIAFQKSRGVPHPLVGLLNIGTEEKKGTQELRDAYQQLLTLNEKERLFIGNIEGRDVFKGEIDVLVTDGFTGNVFLKTAEGIAGFILDQLKSESAFSFSPFLRVLITALERRLQYADYPGAVLAGIDGVVVKCHGNLEPIALVNAIKGASLLVTGAFLEKIRSELC